MKQPAIAIVTTFYEIGDFSVTAVVTNQIQQLLAHGIVPTVIVQEGQPGLSSVIPFKEIPENTPGPHNVWNKNKIDLRPVLPALHLGNSIADDFEDRVERIEKALLKALKDANVVITHDIMLLDTYHEHNVAVRRVAHQRPDILWLHWLHSCPAHTTEQDYPVMCRGVVPPGYLVYPNYSHAGFAQRAYRLAGQEWRVKICKSGHGINLLDALGLLPQTKTISHETGMSGKDVVMIYPARMGESKQFHKIVMMMAGVKEAGYTGRLIGVDWQSLGREFIDYKNRCLDLAERLGIGGWVHFTSEIAQEFATGVPHRVVLELMLLGNVFVSPSISETVGLTVIEASAIGGCLLCLNFDLKPHSELFGDKALYFDFGALDAPRKWKDEVKEIAFWKQEARRLVAELTLNNRALWARTKMRQEWNIFGPLWPEFERLFYLDPQPGHPGPWWPVEVIRSGPKYD